MEKRRQRESKQFMGQVFAVLTNISHEITVEDKDLISVLTCKTRRKHETKRIKKRIGQDFFGPPIFTMRFQT